MQFFTWICFYLSLVSNLYILALVLLIANIVHSTIWKSFQKIKINNRKLYPKFKKSNIGPSTCSFRWCLIHHLDIKNAFLHDHLFGDTWLFSLIYIMIKICRPHCIILGTQKICFLTWVHSKLYTSLFIFCVVTHCFIF